MRLLRHSGVSSERLIHAWTKAGSAHAALDILVLDGDMHDDAARECRRRWQQSAPTIGAVLAEQGVIQRGQLTALLAAFSQGTSAQVALASDVPRLHRV